MASASSRVSVVKRAADDGVQTEFLSSVCGYNLHRATYRLATDFLRSLGDTGMRPVLVSILSVVDENPGISQGAVGQTLGIARANMAPLMSELQTLKLLRRTRNKNDRRVFAIRLTEQGERMLAECKARIRSHENRMLGNLTAAERSHLVALLGKIHLGERGGAPQRGG
jgi:DNA-binding MarR family transcriptional regulator